MPSRGAPILGVVGEGPLPAVEIDGGQALAAFHQRNGDMDRDRGFSGTTLFRSDHDDMWRTARFHCGVQHGCASKQSASRRQLPPPRPEDNSLSKDNVWSECLRFNSNRPKKKWPQRDGHGEAGGGLRFGVLPENFVPSQSTTPPERNMIARRVAGQIGGSMPYQTTPSCWLQGLPVGALYQPGTPRPSTVALFSPAYKM